MKDKEHISDYVQGYDRGMEEGIQRGLKEAMPVVYLLGAAIVIIILFSLNII